MDDNGDFKRNFLLVCARSDTRSSSFQHSQVYCCSTPPDLEKQRFIGAFNQKLENLESLYALPVSESKHLETIQAFADDLSLGFAPILYEGRLRIGTAQKAVNLYLKYLWCFGMIPDPPHCPIDRVVLNEIKSTISWTRIKKMDTYCEIIAELREHCGGKSLAEWECTLWNNFAQPENIPYA